MAVIESVQARDGALPPTLLTVLAVTAAFFSARAGVLLGDHAVAGVSTPLWWMNVLPAALFVGVLLGLTGKLVLSCWLNHWVLWGVYAANAEKLEHLGTSLRPDDFWVLPSLLMSPTMMLRYVESSADISWLFVMVALTTTALAVWEPRSFRGPLMLRLIFTSACGVALWSVVATTWWEARLKPFYSPHFSLWNPEQGVRSDGLLAGLLRLTWAANTGPIAPDIGSVTTFLADNEFSLSARKERALPTVLADVVVVQSESLFDPGDLVGFDRDAVLPEFRRLAGLGLSGKLAVPTFAGGTIRTEYEVLSGYPLDAFPAVEYPYLGIGLRTPTSLPRTLGDLGYHTAFVHPHLREFYNREQVMPALGFHQLEFYETFRDAPTHGWYTTDEALFARVEAMLPDTGPPVFIFAVTMENHGPWSKPRGLDTHDLAAHLLPRGVPAEADAELREYLTLLASGDRALGAFGARLLRRSRPTLLVFYGDHLPDLPHTYRSLRFADGQPARAQRVPYLLVGNLGYPKASLDTDSEFLPSLILDALQAPYRGYLAVNGVARDSLAFGSLDEGGRDHVRNALRAAAQADFVNAGNSIVDP